jgi:hypothetical protein
MSTKTKTATTTVADTMSVVVSLAVDGYAGVANVYAVVNGNVVDLQRVELVDGRPVQVKLEVPREARYVRVIVTDEKEQNVLIDKTASVPMSGKLELGNLGTWLAVGVQEPEKASVQSASPVSSAVSPDLQQEMQQLAQELQELDTLKQQVEQIKQATVTALSQEE